MGKGGRFAVVYCGMNTVYTLITYHNQLLIKAIEVASKN
jgi:hypothetical protein